MLSPAQVDHYNTEGYTVVGNFLSNEQIAAFIDEMDAANLVPAAPRDHSIASVSAATPSLLRSGGRMVMVSCASARGYALGLTSAISLNCWGAEAGRRSAIGPESRERRVSGRGRRGLSARDGGRRARTLF